LVGDLDYSFHQGDAGTMGVVQEPEPKEPTKPRYQTQRRKKMVKKPVLDDDGRPVEGVEVEVESDEEEEVQVLVADPDPVELPPAAPTEYTICSPQLLHLDTDGQPLWFNGWLQDNKFADKKSKKFGRFEHYLIEPRDVRDPGAWQLEESNMCCLTTDAELKRDFSKQEKDTLQMMIHQALEVGA
jgi:hypothetical protein